MNMFLPKEMQMEGEIRTKFLDFKQAFDAAFYHNKVIYQTAEGDSYWHRANISCETGNSVHKMI